MFPSSELRHSIGAVSDSARGSVHGPIQTGRVTEALVQHSPTGRRRLADLLSLFAAAQVYVLIGRCYPATAWQAVGYPADRVTTLRARHPREHLVCASDSQ
jgi:hypothetical protein